jgi:hypothetical protein
MNPAQMRTNWFTVVRLNLSWPSAIEHKERTSTIQHSILTHYSSPISTTSNHSAMEHLHHFHTNWSTRREMDRKHTDSTQINANKSYNATICYLVSHPLSHPALSSCPVPNTNLPPPRHLIQSPSTILLPSIPIKKHKIKQTGVCCHQLCSTTTSSTQTISPNQPITFTKSHSMPINIQEKKTQCKHLSCTMNRKDQKKKRMQMQNAEGRIK